MLVDPGSDRGGAAAAVRLLPGLGHGEDLHLAGRLDAALGVGRLARVLAAVLGESLLDRDCPDAVLVLDLEDLGGAEGLAVLGPRDLRVRVPLHLDPELQETAVPHVQVGLQAADEAGEGSVDTSCRFRNYSRLMQSNRVAVVFLCNSVLASFLPYLGGHMSESSGGNASSLV